MPIASSYQFFRDTQIGRLARNILSDETENIRVLYASRGGTAQRFAEVLGERLNCEVSSISGFAFDGIFAENCVVFVIASDAESQPVGAGVEFYKLLEDAAQDFRVSRDVLSKLRYSVIGIGSIEYGMDNFCLPARALSDFLHSLGGLAMTPALLVTDTEDLDSQTRHCLEMLQASAGSQKGQFALAWSKEVGLNFEADSEGDDVSSSSSENELAVEDAGDENCATKEMLTARQRKQLEKEGYKIIGSHSAVKLCRWTKHHTRGRGGCYKHTFYGISSMNCMEATPSLACANKCVFCWRHHKNPVGTSWKWKTDPADEIVAEAINLHSNLIKQLRGVPGVTEASHRAALNVKHCALSLVGEPIMYPQINELISELHARRISTFLVTNAQFPAAIRTLKPVTQLYVSVDAGSKETLKKTDRPLFQDFWERYIDSFKSIAEKRQRTVYRLTLVKEYNMTDDADERMIQEYVELVKLGQPDFIEIKAVTFCGNNENDKDNLTMKNVPWHEEVRRFSLALASKVHGEYEVACEHKHSCSVLIALKNFKVNNVWHTWIDYDKFADLALSGREDFTPEEYWAPTPEWAVFGADEQGFDPEQIRHFRKTKAAQ